MLRAEIDLVIEFGPHETWAIEIKRSLAPRVTRGFHAACADLTPTRAFVVYAGEERFPMPRSIEAIGVVELATMLAERGDAP